MTAKHTRPMSDFVWMLAGPIVWAAHFFLVYGVEAVICTRAASPVTTMRWIVAVATALALGALVVFIFRTLAARRKDSPVAIFVPDVSIALALLSIGAVAGVAVSGLTLQACVPPAG